MVPGKGCWQWEEKLAKGVEHSLQFSDIDVKTRKVGGPYPRDLVRGRDAPYLDREVSVVKKRSGLGGQKGRLADRYRLLSTSADGAGRQE